MILRVKPVKDIANERLAEGSDAVMAQLASLDWQAIAQCPWAKSFPYCPEVRFQIGHSERAIYLHYEVREEFIKAQYIRINENVWEDSCVEFFLSLDGRKTYYNVEFNVLGTGLVGYGPQVKSERQRLNPELTAQIDTYTSVFNTGGKKTWRMLLAIPKSIFGGNIPLDTVLHANFYKCGDGLPQPHYLAWNNIENPTPNFHLPAYFGELVFEK